MKQGGWEGDRGGCAEVAGLVSTLFEVVENMSMNFMSSIKTPSYSFEMTNRESEMRV